MRCTPFVGSKYLLFDNAVSFSPPFIRLHKFLARSQEVCAQLEQTNERSTHAIHKTREKLFRKKIMKLPLTRYSLFLKECYRITECASSPRVGS